MIKEDDTKDRLEGEHARDEYRHGLGGDYARDAASEPVADEAEEQPSHRETE